MEKHIIIVVQATPKTQPGGVQGAWLRLVYHSLFGPLFMSQLPIPRAPKFNNKKVRSSSELINEVANSQVGEKITLTLIRNSKVRNVKVSLGDHPDNTRFKKTKVLKTYQGQKAPYNLGFFIKDYSKKMIKEFDLVPLKKGRPVIIEVKPGSAASSAQLLPGDIILDVNRKEVFSAKDVLKRLSNKKVNVLKILRGESVFITYISVDN